MLYQLNAHYIAFTCSCILIHMHTLLKYSTNTVMCTLFTSPEELKTRQCKMACNNTVKDSTGTHYAIVHLYLMLPIQ